MSADGVSTTCRSTTRTGTGATTQPRRTEHLGRACVALETPIATVLGPHARGRRDRARPRRERATRLPRRRLAARRPGELRVVLRPAHQMGNPDAVQYTPVFNDISAWQLYHGPGFWAPLDVPARRLVHDPGRLRGTRGPRCSSAMPWSPALVVGELKQRGRRRADRDHGRQPRRSTSPASRTAEPELTLRPAGPPAPVPPTASSPTGSSRTPSRRRSARRTALARRARRGAVVDRARRRSRPGSSTSPA